MTLPIKICLIGSEPLYSKEYHLHKRENGKIQMYFRQILQKKVTDIFWKNIEKKICTKSRKIKANYLAFYTK